MAKSHIPGLDYIPVKESAEGNSIACIGFNLRSFKVPGSCIGNNRRINEFQKIKKISRGRFGNIYKVKDTADKEIYALKELLPPESKKLEPMPLSFLHQINNLKRLKHLNITNLKEVVVGSRLDCNFLLLDYCEYNLKEVIQKVDSIFFMPQHIKNIMLQLLSGLQYLHSEYILHRDLCPKNILFTENGILKISDFGSNTVTRDGDMTPNKGLRWYRAPEILFGSTKYSKASDIFSVGIIFGEMVLQKPLLRGSTEGKVVRSLIDLLGTPSEKHWPGFSNLPVPRDYHLPQHSSNKIKYVFSNQTRTTVNYIKRMLKYNPAKRPSAQDLMQDIYYTEPLQACTNEKLLLLLKLSKSL